ncbi:unnamed protein product [Linum trigynum]|uniref:Uncharacterized protein n=1 Tax=Linum trigynum TaxID=586398 RepID=A0AAV2FC69_9ROSI
MSAKTTWPSKISITPDSMKEMFISVEYCHVPAVCNTCSVFGHNCAVPQGETRKVWRKKQNHTVSLPEVLSQEASSLEVQLAAAIGAEVVEDLQSRLQSRLVHCLQMRSSIWW